MNDDFRARLLLFFVIFGAKCFRSRFSRCSPLSSSLLCIETAISPHTLSLSPSMNQCFSSAADCSITAKCQTFNFELEEIFDQLFYGSFDQSFFAYIPAPSVKKHTCNQLSLATTSAHALLLISAFDLPDKSQLSTRQSFITLLFPVQNATHFANLLLVLLCQSLHCNNLYCPSNCYTIN